MYTCLVASLEETLFVLSLLLCVSMPTVSAECGCHKALGSMWFRMFHLISLTSPVSRRAKRHPREPRHPVEQSCLPEGPALALSQAHCLRARETMRNQSADRYTKQQLLWMTTRHKRQHRASIWDSVQTAVRADWALHRSYQSQHLTRLQCRLSPCWQYNVSVCGRTPILPLSLLCASFYAAQWPLWLPRMLLWPRVKQEQMPFFTEWRGFYLQLSQFIPPLPPSSLCKDRPQHDTFDPTTPNKAFWKYNQGKYRITWFWS